MNYRVLAEYFAHNPHEIPTAPLNRRNPLWFYAYAENGVIYVESAKMHSPSSKISQRRPLNIKEYDTMLDLYHRRKAGEAVSVQAGQMTHNQVYWYGIFKELEL